MYVEVRSLWLQWNESKCLQGTVGESPGTVVFVSACYFAASDLKIFAFRSFNIDESNKAKRERELNHRETEKGNKSWEGGNKITVAWSLFPG